MKGHAGTNIRCEKHRAPRILSEPNAPRKGRNGMQGCLLIDRHNHRRLHHRDRDDDGYRHHHGRYRNRNCCFCCVHRDPTGLHEFSQAKVVLEARDSWISSPVEVQRVGDGTRIEHDLHTESVDVVIIRLEERLVLSHARHALIEKYTVARPWEGLMVPDLIFFCFVSMVYKEQ